MPRFDFKSELLASRAVKLPLPVNAKHCGHIRANSGEAMRGRSRRRRKEEDGRGGGCGDIPGIFVSRQAKTKKEKEKEKL